MPSIVAEAIAMRISRRGFSRIARGAALAALLPAAATARQRRWETSAEWGVPFDDPWQAQPPSPFRLSDAEVTEAFLDAALGRLGESPAPHFLPWRGPIRALLFGEVGSQQRAIAERTLAWCRMATGLPVSPPGGEAANLGIVFSDQPMDDLTGPLWERTGAALFPSREALRSLLQHAGPCFALAPPGRGIGLIALPATLPGEDLACLPRMILGLLGLKGHLGHAMPSVLSGAGVAREPTPLDRLLAALATDPALPPGLDEAGLREALPALLPRHRPWAGFDPLAEEQAPPAPATAAPASVFDPDAARTLRAFGAATLPEGASPRQLIRWPERAEVPMHVLGRAPAVTFAALRWTMGWAAAASHLRLRFAETRREEGMTFLLGDTLEGMWDEYGPTIAAYFGNDKGRFETQISGPGARADNALTLLHFSVPGGALVRTLSLVATGGGTALLPQRVGREFLRALGLRGDSAGIGHSLLDRAIPALQPSALDDRVLRLAYAEAMAPGMTPEAAAMAAARLLGLAPPAEAEETAEEP